MCVRKMILGTYSLPILLMRSVLSWIEVGCVKKNILSRKTNLALFPGGWGAEPDQMKIIFI